MRRALSEDPCAKPRSDSLESLVRFPGIAGQIRLEQANIQREDLDMMDIARTIETLIDELQMSKGDIARLLGKSQSFVSKHLALLRATGPSKDALDRGLLQSPETFRLFRKLPEERQKRLLSRKRDAPIARAEVEKAAATRGSSRPSQPTQDVQQFSLRLTIEQMARIIEAVGGHLPNGTGDPVAVLLHLVSHP